MRRTSIVLGALALLGAGSGVALAQPSGSYAATCGRIQQRGPFLQALCLDRAGNRVLSRLDLRGCGGGDITNNNGRLTCAGGRGSARREDEGSRRDFDRSGERERRLDDRRDRRFEDRRERGFEDERRGRDDRGREFGRRGWEEEDDRLRRRERRDEYERRY